MFPDQRPYLAVRYLRRRKIYFRIVRIEFSILFWNLWHEGCKTLCIKFHPGNSIRKMKTALTFVLGFTLFTASATLVQAHGHGNGHGHGHGHKHNHCHEREYRHYCNSHCHHDRYVYDRGYREERVVVVERPRPRPVVSISIPL